jgi:ABC-type branched-subunit amino acid transport system ATPase component
VDGWLSDGLTCQGPGSQREFADIGYVMVSGTIAIAGSGDELLENSDVGRLFLGG